MQTQKQEHASAPRWCLGCVQYTFRPINMGCQYLKPKLLRQATSDSWRSTTTRTWECHHKPTRFCTFNNGRIDANASKTWILQSYVGFQHSDLQSGHRPPIYLKRKITDYSKIQEVSVYFSNFCLLQCSCQDMRHKNTSTHVPWCPMQWWNIAAPFWMACSTRKHTASISKYIACSMHMYALYGLKSPSPSQEADLSKPVQHKRLDYSPLHPPQKKHLMPCQHCNMEIRWHIVE